ncbi:MAG: hypothetical protein L0387_42785 [Acidobacteria bacterium]|nr:hypothetical protein [Acidobacteriota bacterium]
MNLKHLLSTGKALATASFLIVIPEARAAIAIVTPTTDNPTTFAGHFSISEGTSAFATPVVFPYLDFPLGAEAALGVSDLGDRMSVAAIFAFFGAHLSDYPKDPAGTTYLDRTGSFPAFSDGTPVDWVLSNVRWEGLSPELVFSGSFVLTTPVPEPSTIVAGALLLLPLGAGLIRHCSRRKS